MAGPASPRLRRAFWPSASGFDSTVPPAPCSQCCDHNTNGPANACKSCNENPRKSLGEHLTDLVAYGVLDPSRDTRTLAVFAQHAPVEIREHVLAEVGRKLNNAPGDLDPAILKNLQNLWDWWGTATRNLQERSDLRAFGWWFAAGAFESDWAFSRLHQVLEITGGRLDWDHAVLKRLQALVGTHATHVGKCPAAMTRDPEEWFVGRCGKELRDVLGALKCTGEAPMPSEVASRLLANGAAEFRDLA